MVNISCPFYLPWFDKVSQGSVRRQCGTNGLWETDESGQTWRDISECEEKKEVASQELWLKQLMVGFRTSYTDGYSLSLSTLIMALIIVLSFRQRLPPKLLWWYNLASYAQLIIRTLGTMNHVPSLSTSGQHSFCLHPL
ncbi:hypothetical protein XENOCAPTIV_006479 [Xenoophorus captivus]|uniref:G-protein coupled receptors family 2 profile 1 domain-containing protein n=1 Tax=Xenoophorus captivus TaxID=1517983 RepID=A0ABV0RZG9_9TELE